MGMHRIFPVQYRAAAGFTLLEVLVALGILAFAMVIIAESLFHLLFAEERAGSMLATSLQIQSVSSQHAAGVYTNIYTSYPDASRLSTGRKSDEEWQVFEITAESPSDYLVRMAVPPEKSDATSNARNNSSMLFSR